MAIVMLPPHHSAPPYPAHSGGMLCNDLKTGYWKATVMVPNRHAAAVIAALTIGVAAVPARGQPVPRAPVPQTPVPQTRVPQAPVIVCTNPASGTTWQISIDYDRATVDSYPARVSDAEISWHDAKDGGNYTLDRGSGDLTVILASSTGGYFLHHRCALPP